MMATKIFSFLTEQAPEPSGSMQFTEIELDTWIERLKKTVSKDGDNIQAYLDLIVLLNLRGQTNTAFLLASNLLLHPMITKDQKALLYASLAQSLINHQPHQALKHIQESLSLDQHSQKVLYVASIVFLKLRSFDTALEHSQNLLSKNQNFRTHHIYILNQSIVGLLKETQLNKAKPLLEKLIQLDPNHAIAYAQLAYVNCQLQNHEQALKQLHEAFKLKPQQFEWIKLLEHIHFEMGAFEKIIQTVNHWLSSVSSSMLRLALARFYIKTRQFDKALDQLDQGIKLDPNNSHLLSQWVEMKALNDSNQDHPQNLRL